MIYRTATRWDEGEFNLAVDLFKKGVTPKEITKILNSRYHANRSVNAVHSCLSKHGYQKKTLSIEPIESVIGAEPNKTPANYIAGMDDHLIQRLYSFCQEHIKDGFAKRNAIIYNTLKFQAQQIKAYDSKAGIISVYEKKPLEEIMRLPEAERTKVIEMLTKGEERENYKGFINLVVTPGVDRSAGVLFPLFPQDVKISKRSLASAIHDVSLSVLLNYAGFRINKDNPIENVQDLLKYSFSYDRNIASEDIEKRINESLVKEYPARISVYLNNENQDFFRR